MPAHSKLQSSESVQRADSSLDTSQAAGASFVEGAAARAPAAGGFQTGLASQGLQMQPDGEAVQFLGTPLDQEAPATEPKPTYGEDEGEQRRFSPDQYVEMWEQEQGRKMTAGERETIDRGCIGLTATNLNGGGNPLASAEKTYAKFEQAQKYMEDKNRVLDWWAKIPLIGRLVPKARYQIFAKLFWSNQSPKWEDRLKPDDKAFLPDPKTGEVDMSGYEYEAQSKWEEDDDGDQVKSSYVNFDYGFWDSASQCFWHANHMEYKDPVLRKKMGPMKVLQSTKGKFIAGYFDFDRIVFGVAKANNYDPGLAAISNAGGPR